jgi:hypothetical protein
MGFVAVLPIFQTSIYQMTFLAIFDHLSPTLSPLRGARGCQPADLPESENRRELTERYYLDGGRWPAILDGYEIS